MKLACRYAIIQFMPYPETGEFANAGIVLACPKTGFFGYRLEKKKYARITDFFSELHGSVYKGAIGNFEAELIRVSQELAAKAPTPELMRNMFDYLVHPREAIVRFGQPRAALVDSPAVALDQFFDYYVGRNFVTKEYQEEVITRRVANLLNSLDLTLPFKEEKLGTTDYSVKFPLVQLNEDGIAKKLIKPLFLGQTEPNKIYDHGDRWLAKLARLRKMKALPERAMFALTYPESHFERRLEAAFTIKQELSGLDIEVIEAREEHKLKAFAKE